MRGLLVYPRFPITYWGLQHAMWIAGRRATIPPLSLITLAAQLPQSWELRLVDLNIEPLRDEQLRWADVVLVGAMRVQGPSAHEVLARARSAARATVIGGPAPTTSPGEYADADVIFQGEVEGRVDDLVEAVEEVLQQQRPAAPQPSRLLQQQGALPPLNCSPIPRFDLLRLDAYTSSCIQFSRGCPFTCEFCDIIEVYGRKPRLKTTEQIIAELQALYDLGYRGSLFFVDDNFIGNRRAVRRLLQMVASWQQRRGYPFELFTEASVNLAADRGLLDAMVQAGFNAVFLGIETPSVDALQGAGKQQNTRLDLRQAVEAITRAGVEVMGGFIVGFDQDDRSTIGAQRRFISESPIPVAMIGLLNALPKTALWRRLQREGRLRSSSDGDTFSRPNFAPAMDERQLLEGYLELLRSLYSADGYYDRCRHFLAIAAAPPGRKRAAPHIRALLRAMWQIGIKSPRRWHFWRLLARALRDTPALFPWAVAHAAMGEHMIRYTAEEVVPRIEGALRDLQLERAAPRVNAGKAASVRVASAG